MDGIIETLRMAMEATAWPMTPPKAYGAFHLGFMILGFVICGVLAYRFRKVSERAARGIIIGCGAFLAATEIYKQLFYAFYLWEGSYNWGVFPFHLCSVPMYLCIIAPLLHPGRVQQAMYSFMGSFNLLGGAIAFFEPSGLIHSYWTLTLHAFIWHMMLVFVGLFLCFSGMAGRGKADYFAAVKCFFLLCIPALGFNLGFWEISGGQLNCFFIGPANSSIVVFKYLSQHFGWYVSTAVYLPALCLGAYIMFRLFAAGDMVKIKERVRR